MVDQNAVAAALLKAAEDLRTCKRNKSGTLNGNAKYAIIKSAAEAMIEAGETSGNAYVMAWDLARAAK